jgi:hypothetical protein
MKIMMMITNIFLTTTIVLSQQIDTTVFNLYRLKALDKTDSLQYPYHVSEKREQQLISFRENFKEFISIDSLINVLGNPDRVDDLRYEAKEQRFLSHFESGFLAGSEREFTFRLIWFTHKESKYPGRGDRWVAAYIGIDEKRVLVIHDSRIKY